jgi:phosphoglucosamine mutase
VVHEVEAGLGDDGRVVLRYSGTEDLCRVMVEGPSEAVVHAHVARIVQVVEREIGA